MLLLSTTFFGTTIAFLVIQIRSLSVIPYDPLPLMVKFEVLLVILPRLTVCDSNSPESFGGLILQIIAVYYWRRNSGLESMDLV